MFATAAKPSFNGNGSTSRSFSIAAPNNNSSAANKIRLPSINELTFNSPSNIINALSPISKDVNRSSLPSITNNQVQGQNSLPSSACVSPYQQSRFSNSNSNNHSNYTLNDASLNTNVQKLPSPIIPYHEQHHQRPTPPQQHQQQHAPIGFYTYQQSPIQLPPPPPSQSQPQSQPQPYSPPNGYYQSYNHPQQAPHPFANGGASNNNLHFAIPEVINKPSNKCHRCGTTETPEWRRGPNGVRTLCNACGLFHAKLVKRKGAALAAEEVLNNKVCKGKNGRRISIKKQLLSESNLSKHEIISSDEVDKKISNTNSNSPSQLSQQSITQLPLPPNDFKNKINNNSNYYTVVPNVSNVSNVPNTTYVSTLPPPIINQHYASTAMPIPYH